MRELLEKDGSFPIFCASAMPYPPVGVGRRGVGVGVGLLVGEAVGLLVGEGLGEVVGSGVLVGLGCDVWVGGTVVVL